MNFLITGGAGYIGSHVANLLIDKNYNVVIIDNLSRSSIKLVPKKSFFYKCDISNNKKILNILKKHKIDVVFHFAGYKDVEESNKFPNRYIKNNFIKSKNFIKNCIKNNFNKFIFSSSASVYGNINKKILKETDKLKPSSVYGKTKLKLEKYLIDCGKKYKVKYVICRYFNVAGADPKLRAGLITKSNNNLIKNIANVMNNKKKEFIINGNDYDTTDGTTVRDYIHVSDLADIHYRSMKYLLKSNKSNIFNCGYGQGFTVMDAINIAKKLSNKKFKITIGPRRKNDIEKSVARVNKIKKYIKWKPKYNDLKKIIISSYKWEVKSSKFMI